MIDTFTCEMCGRTFSKSRPDSEANAEALNLWGIKDASSRVGDDMVVVCNDCWRILQPGLPSAN